MTQPGLREIIKFLGETPEAVRRLSAGLTADQLKWKPTPTEFSFVEHVCHLRDIEQEGYGPRIEKLLNETEPFLPDLDGAKLAEERRYNAQDFEMSLREFTGSRRENLGAVGDLPADNLSRGGTFEGVGPVTLETLIRMMCGHDREHRRALADLRERVSRGRAAGV
ncbi:MAG: DinB family protein [Pyrinomonadaceae bacterium]